LCISRLGPLVYSFAILNRSEWGKCGPQARGLINGGRASSWCSDPATATAKIDRCITMPSGQMLLSRHRHGTKTRNHHNVAELIFPHCVRVQARGCSLRGIKRTVFLLCISFQRPPQGRVDTNHHCAPSSLHPQGVPVMRVYSSSDAG
jgi:hypothetical protein